MSSGHEDVGDVALSIVVSCWNNRPDLEACLESLVARPPRTPYEVVVIDNASIDGTPAMVRARFPAVRLIENRHNRGLTAACNQGIRAARGRYVLLLNDDTLVDGASFDALVEFLETTPDAAGAGGKLLNPDGSLQATFADFSTILQELLIATRLGELWRPGYPSREDVADARAVDWIGSACLLLRRDALEQVGLLDEEYFVYGCEVDLQFRLRHAGWRIYYLPYVATVHLGGRSLDRWRRRRMVYRGKVLFFLKSYGRGPELLLRAMLAVLTAGKAAVWSLAWPWPRWRGRARAELRSNVEVLRDCVVGASRSVS